jgi:hypothetical protein
MPTAPACTENAQCPTGQLCNGNGTCTGAGAAGATCDDSNPYVAVQPCQAGLYCQFAAATPDGGTPSTGTCNALGTAGKGCSADDDVNDCADGLFCNAQYLCAAIQFMSVGAACDERGLVCSGSSCDFTSGDASADGVCTAFVSDGASCEQDSIASSTRSARTGPAPRRWRAVTSRPS